MRMWRPLRRHKQIREERILEIKIQGLDHVRQAIERGHGVLITPNHPGHGDCYLLWDALERLKTRCYAMTAWQVFDMAKPLERILYRQHGCFSVNREGNDLQAYRQAISVLAETSYPLIIFPEGDVYHLNDRLTPLREGTAAMALSAVKRSGRPISIIPCGLRYHYLTDPTPQLHDVLDEIERRLYWRPRRDLTLADRIYRVAEGLLRLKELEYLSHSGAGPLPERTQSLSDAILSRIEARYDLKPDVGKAQSKEKPASEGPTIPERVKEVRHRIIQQRDEIPPDDPAQEQFSDDLEDLFFVVQLFSYPGDYVSEHPTLERMAETVDKFEEDFLDYPTARIRGTRRGIVSFGEPIVVATTGNRDSARELTRDLERRIQALLDATESPASARPYPDTATGRISA
jgi:1-acyl-sn-glycerol-3-phosphate acyltransferase